MKHLPRLFRALALALPFLVAATGEISAGEANPAAPVITMDQAGGQMRLVFPYPAAQEYHVLSSDDAAGVFGPDAVTGTLLGPTFVITNASNGRFYRVNVTTMSSNDLFSATVLNRLTYGPTFDDIEHIKAVGPEAFIAEQMAGENITDTINIDPPLTNSLPPPAPLTNWIRRTATGSSTGTNFGIYLSSSGRVYIDNITLVRGTNADEGTNMLVNGDFEEPIASGWKFGSSISMTGTVITNSPTVDGLAASGTNCLLLGASSGTTTLNNGLWQPYLLANPASSNRFTISFWYLPVPNSGTNILTVRLSGTATVSTSALPSIPAAPPAAPAAIAATYARLTNEVANLDDLRAWHVFRAVNSKRQLHEILAQFFQNHLTTQYDKTKEYFDNNFNRGVYTNDVVRQNVSIDLHWREHRKIREALLDPNCTFYDLLKISVESPAMIIYLDTILSSKTTPNQNYAREILELHCMGADNGYIQQDIVDLSRVWTGWRVDKKDASVADNPFATPISRANLTNFANTPGEWVLHYATNSHDVGTKRLFTNGPIDLRFGGQFGGGQSYALILTNTQAVGTNGMAEGYRVAEHLANLPYTMEFLSVKLCQVFVHENFEYGVYDYTVANPSLEVALIKECMTAWNTPAGDGRKGNIRSVLNAIFSSALFRGHAASQQKTKTPLELAISAVRALRSVSSDTNGYVTASSDTDGYGISGRGNTSPLNRMGGMNLFNKPEPDGYSEMGRIWMSTANLAERMRFVQHLLMPNTSSTKDDDYTSVGLVNRSDPVRLMQLKMEGDKSDAAAVVDFFLALLYPGEGAGNTGRDRAAAIAFLNSNETGAPNSSPFNLLSGAAYDGRVRSMVGFLMSLPRFQEQ